MKITVCFSSAIFPVYILRERDVGIICVVIYDDLALEAWTQRRERERRKVKVFAVVLKKCK